MQFEGADPVQIDADVGFLGIDGQHRALLLMDDEFRAKLAAQSGVSPDKLLTVPVHVLHAKTPLSVLTFISKEKNELNEINVKTSFWDRLKEFRSTVAILTGHDPTYAPTAADVASCQISDIHMAMHPPLWIGPSVSSGQVAWIKSKCQFAPEAYIKLVEEDNRMFEQGQRVFNGGTFYVSLISNLNSKWPIDAKIPWVTEKQLRQVCGDAVLKVCLSYFGS